MKAKLIFKTPDDGYHYYFGYYDKSPLSKDGEKLLALRVSFIDKIPEANDIATIGYFDLKKSNQFVELSQTNTFNWQQGCMLQWLGPDHNNKIIYNDLVDGVFSSVIFNISNTEKQILPMAVYSVFSDGSKALCIDNERHHWCRRGYSYDGVYNESKNKNIVPGDGIFTLDLNNGDVSLIITTEQMNKIKPISSMNEGPNYLEHLMVNPSGTQFAFLHRWKNFGGIYARLYVADTDGKNIKIINNSGRMSHFCWKNDTQILGWGGLRNAFNLLRSYKNFAKYIVKPLMPFYRRLAKGDSVEGNSVISRVTSGDSYIVFDINTGKSQRILPRHLNKDGHPSVCPSNESIFLSDTYPGSESKCQLLAVNMESGEIFELDRLNSMPKYDNSPIRCDLHPKWSFCGYYVSVDTMHEKRRSIYLYEIERSYST